MATTTRKTTTIDVPQRGRRWVKDALVRDRTTRTLYRVASLPVYYHEDALPVQRVVKVRQLPADWQKLLRLLAIMDRVRTEGLHTPGSRGAYGRPADQVGESPATTGAGAEWEAREDAHSYAAYPRLRAAGDVLTVVAPNSDDAPTVVWLRDAELAAEAAALIATAPRLTAYPAVNVRGA